MDNTQPVAPIIPVKSDTKEVLFHFKKEKIKDAEGKVIGEGKKLPSLKLSIPVPSAEGILDIVAAGGKGLELLQEALQDVVFVQSRNLINEIRVKSPEAEIKPEQISIDQLAWNFIATLAPAARRGLGISDEDWEEFFTDYRNIMPTVTGKDKERVEKHVALFKSKYQRCRNDKKALKVLQEMLELWASHTTAMEDNTAVYEYLKERVETLLKEEEKILAEAL